MLKVENVSIWLRWAVNPASALRVLLALSMHFLLPLLRPYLPLSLQVGNLFMPFFLLSHPAPRPGAPLPSRGAPRARKDDAALPGSPRRPRAARIQRCPVLLPSAHAQSYSLYNAGAEVGDMEGGEVGEVWGAGVCSGLFCGGGE
ncbi:hypothetical protein B0H13DRAFT_2405392 [Mycena leptocephala]|nr:hypothetical protein B0H13DRAFT_2405392 [Mycena leptocephala]